MTTLPDIQSLNEESPPSRVIMVSEKFKNFGKSVDRWEIFYTLLLGIYTVSTLIMILMDFNDYAEAVFLGLYFTQQVPAIVLIIYIIFRTYPDNQTGPLLKSKIFLGTAALLGITSELPLNIWAQILPSNCVFAIASWVDVIHLVYCSSVLFFFLFIRSEYKRNSKEYHFNTVTEIQRSYG